MDQTPAQQWNALSALYEEADDMSASQLVRWMAALGRQAHPLLPQLQRMLEARGQVETDDFLLTLPKFDASLRGRAATEGADSPGDVRWAPGSRVGPYRLVEPLGEGGMAEVWLADRDDGAFTRRVAVKLPFMRAGREALVARFDRERDILASLRHPHIAGLLDAGVTAQGQAWLALEYVEGEPLSTFCDRQRLSVRGRVALFRQVLLAVQHAHANLVIHRDLKPGNILVSRQGEARLLDFGIAKLLEAEGGATVETELTRVEGRSLTPRYASPEQLEGRPLTIACDVYALGVVLYELLCGERPYELRAESVAQLEQAILEAEPRAPSRRAGNESLAADRATTARQLCRILSPELDAVVLRCLRKTVAERYSSVDALLADIDRWLDGEAVLARSPSPWYRFGKFALRHRLGVSMSVAGLAVLIAMTTAATLSGFRAREESSRAVASRDFMLQLFRGADREKSRGKDITARELLDSGRNDVMTTLAGQPVLQADLLYGIASIQFEMGEFGRSDATFEQLVGVATADGQTTMLIRALAGQADSALRLGDFKRAERILEKTGSLHGPPDADADTVARLELVRGWIAAFSGKPEVGLQSFKKAYGLAFHATGRSDPKALDALGGEIYVENLRRNYPAAFALQSEVETIVRSQPKPDFRELAGLAFRRANLTLAAGRYAEGLSLSSNSLADCIARLGANDERCRRLTIVKLSTRVRMGYGDADIQDLRMAELLTSDSQTPIVQVDAVYNLLKLESFNGDTPRQRALAAQARALVDEHRSATNRQMNDTTRMKLLIGLAESELLVHHPESSARWADQALSIQGGKATPDGLNAWPTWSRMIRGIALRWSKNAAVALPELVAARDQLCKVFSATHPTCHLAELNVAAVLVDLQRVPEASAIVERVKPDIAVSFGVSSPMYGRLISFENDLRRPDHPTPFREVKAIPYIFI